MSIDEIIASSEGANSKGNSANGNAVGNGNNGNGNGNGDKEKRQIFNPLEKVYELYFEKTDKKKLTDAKFLDGMMREAIHLAKAEILPFKNPAVKEIKNAKIPREIKKYLLSVIPANLPNTYKFKGGGVTGVYILKEPFHMRTKKKKGGSHGAIHTAPEHLYGSLEMATCGNSFPFLATRYLLEQLNPWFGEISFSMMGKDVSPDYGNHPMQIETVIRRYADQFDFNKYTFLGTEFAPGDFDFFFFKLSKFKSKDELEQNFAGFGLNTKTFIDREYQQIKLNQNSEPYLVPFELDKINITEEKPSEIKEVKL